MPKKYNTALRNYLTSVVDDENCATDYCAASSTVPVPGLSIAPGSSTYSTPLQSDGSNVMTGNLQVQGDTSTGGTVPDGPGIKLIEKDSVGGNDLIAQIKDVSPYTKGSLSKIEKSFMAIEKPIKQGERIVIQEVLASKLMQNLCKNFFTF